jgi:hypothetical protein
VHVGVQPRVAAGWIGTPWQSHVDVHVGEHEVGEVGGVTRDGVMGLPWQSQVEVHVGEHVVGAGGGVTCDGVTGVMGVPWQSQVDVHVGKHVEVEAAIGRPEQSQLAVHVGEHRGATIGLPEQSQVDVHCGEHLAAATIGLPEQSQVDVHWGEHLPPTSDEEVVDVEVLPTEPDEPVLPGAPTRPAATGTVPTSGFLAATVVGTAGAFSGAAVGGVAVSTGVAGAATVPASSAVTTPVSSVSLLTSQPAVAVASERGTSEKEASRTVRKRICRGFPNVVARRRQAAGRTQGKARASAGMVSDAGPPRSIHSISRAEAFGEATPATMWARPCSSPHST